MLNVARLIECQNKKLPKRDIFIISQIKRCIQKCALDDVRLPNCKAKKRFLNVSGYIFRFMYKNTFNLM